VLKIIDAGAVCDGGGQHVDGAIYGTDACHLSAQKSTILACIDQLDRLVGSSGIVAGMIIALGDTRHVRDPGLIQSPAVEASAGYRQVKDLDDGCADGAAIGRRAPCDSVSGNARLAVRRSGQCDGRRLSCDRISHLHGIPDGIDVRIRCAHLIVDDDVTAGSQGQPRVLRELVLRSNADREHHQISLAESAAGEIHLQPPVACPFDGLESVSQGQAHVLPPELPVYDARHVRIDRGHYLR